MKEQKEEKDSADSDEEKKEEAEGAEKEKRIMMPRRKFRWNLEIKYVL